MNPLLVIAGGLPLVLNLSALRLRTAHSFPVVEYSNAVERVEIRQALDDSVVVPGARSILLSHGDKTPRVYVLLHGFTDSPKQFAALGERLFATGDNVYIPRLPHHSERAYRVKALGRVRVSEMVAFGDSTVDIAHGLGDSIIVVGLSAGGNIAVSIAQHRPDVQRAVLIAPAIAAGRVSRGIARNIMRIGSWFPDIVKSHRSDSTRPDFVQGISTKGLGQVLALGEALTKASTKAPAQAKQIIFLLNENDHTVSDDASIELARNWNTGQSLVSAYQFPKSLKLLHNTMEATEHGGNLEVVLPVVEALARGTRVPEDARYVFLVSDWTRPRLPN
jgi:carboxylesterase